MLCQRICERSRGAAFLSERACAFTACLDLPACLLVGCLGVLGGWLVTSPPTDQPANRPTSWMPGCLDRGRSEYKLVVVNCALNNSYCNACAFAKAPPISQARGNALDGLFLLSRKRWEIEFQLGLLTWCTLSHNRGRGSWLLRVGPRWFRKDPAD